MSRYALILNGQVLEYRELASTPSRVGYHDAKPYLVAVATIRPKFDPVAEVLEGPAIEVSDIDVVERYTVRPKNTAEVEAMRATKIDDIEREFQRLCAEPIEFAVGGVLYDWHADADAVINITGVVLLIAAGVPVSDPRPWTPLESMTPVDITHAELIGMGAAIAGRKDALFVLKKSMQAEVATMTDPLHIAEFGMEWS